MDRAEFIDVRPVLMCSDVAKSLAFYRDLLGFEIQFQDSPTEPKYAVIARGSVQLHLQWNSPSDFSAGDRPMYRFLIDEVDNLFDEYVASGAVERAKSVKDTAWGTREFGIYDPDRNGLLFYKSI